MTIELNLTEGVTAMATFDEQFPVITPYSAKDLIGYITDNNVQEFAKAVEAKPELLTQTWNTVTPQGWSNARGSAEIKQIVADALTQ